MGIMPLEFSAGESPDSLGLTGEESYDIAGISGGVKPGAKIAITATDAAGEKKQFTTTARIDTPDEAEYYRHDGILQYVLRQIRGSS